MPEPELPLTELLQRFAAGDRELGQLIAAAIGPKLHEMAQRAARQERSQQALSTMDIVNELWVNLMLKGRFVIESRKHFFALAARVIRHLLVNEARRRSALSRGGATQHVPIGELIAEPSVPSPADPETVLELDRMMDRLEAKDPALARILEMRHFCGFTREEVAVETGLSERRVRYLERKANDWMRANLSGQRHANNGLPAQ